jgi:hypothetical protein
MIIDGTATPLFNQSLSAGGVGIPKLPAVSLPIPRCMAMLGRPCVQLQGDLQFFEAHGAEVTGVQVLYENYGLEFWRTANAHVHGNWVGTVDESGAFSGPGLVLRESSVHVGGARPWEQNVISGNENGIDVLYNLNQPNHIENNLIGTGPNGRDEVGNSGEGISVTGSGPVIENNVIAASEDNGIHMSLSSTDPGSGQELGALITGNKIGLSDSEAPMGNGRWGVRIDSSSGHTVGGEEDGQANQIAHNDLGGIQVQAGRHNRFSRNAIWDNGSNQAPGALGINLAADLLDQDVPTPNDPLDIDGEPGPPFNVSNNLQNHPQVLSVEKDDDKTIINAALESRPDTSYRLEFFVNANCEPQRHGEGESFLVAKTVTTSDNGKTGIGFKVPEKLDRSEYVTATATSPGGDTSEFSPATSRDGPCTATFTVNNAGDVDDGDVSDGLCDTGTAMSGHTGVCTLRAAITQANWLTGHDTIAFGLGSGARTIAPTDSLPVITDSVAIDGTTQPGFSGTPLIRLDGETGGAVGLRVSDGGGTSIRGLSVTGWYGTGIIVQNSRLTWLAGNYIGLAQDGQTAAPNGDGVYMNSSPNSTIGGTKPADRNVISGNAGDGIWLQGSSGNEGIVVQGNRIGTNSDGTAAVPNQGNGATVGSDDVLVGGSSAAAGNLVSGNAGDGINLTAKSDLLQNKIGTNAAGTGQVPNGDDGIQLATAPGAQIGAPGGDGNSIAFNGGNGIEGWAGTSIRRNRIFENDDKGIALTSSGPPELEPPSLISVKSDGRIRGTVEGEPSEYAVELFVTPGPCDADVEARSFKQRIEVTIGAGDSSQAFSGRIRRLRGAVTGTVTQVDGPNGGNTSEISACKSPGG